MNPETFAQEKMNEVEKGAVFFLFVKDQLMEAESFSQKKELTNEKFDQLILEYKRFMVICSWIKQDWFSRVRENQKFAFVVPEYLMKFHQSYSVLMQPYHDFLGILDLRESDFSHNQELAFHTRDACSMLYTKMFLDPIPEYYLERVC